MERITRDFYRNRTEKTKRWLGLLTFCMMLGSMQTSAQIWTIDDCTPGSPLGSAAYGPMYSTTNANATNRTAMFYPASQLTGIAGQELTGIYFNKITSNDMTGSPYLKIYLKETTDTDFGTGALAWDDAILGATLVYEDNPATAVAGSSGWKELSFSSNYTYSGTNNLVLITEYVNGGNTVNTTWWYEYTNSCIDTSNNDTTKYVNNTTGVPGESLSSSNYRRPIIGFDFTVDCPAPTDVLLSDITTTGITINWTAGGTETDWDYAFQPIGSGVPTSFSQTTSATLTVSDLSPSTGYEFYVRADCGGSDGESVWKGPYEFYTACGVATSEFYEGFETTPPGGSTNPTVPQCWSFIDTGSGYGYTSSTTPQEGVRNFYMYNGPASDTGHYILVSPETDNLGSGTMRVKFWARTTSTVVSPLTYIDFGTLSSNTDETTFTVVESIPLTNVYTEYTVIIPATTDDYFGFRHDLVTKARYIYIDSITYEDIPSCLEPSDLTASNILTDSVDLYWVSDGNLFDIEYGEAGFTQGTGTIISDITSSPYTLTGLNAMTTYEVYIRRDCGGGDESPWVSAPISFMTACGSAPTLDENFDDYGTGSIVPECWVRLTAATGTGSQTISSTTPASGTRNIYQYASSTQNPVIVVLPEFSNIDAGTHWLRFKARVSSGAPGALQVGYVTDATDYDSFVLLETLTINNTSYTADDAEYIISVPTTVPSAARLAIKNSADGKSYYWDDVIWEGAPSCLPPLGLSYAQLSMTSAELSWTSTGSLFDIEWGAQGFTQGSGTMVTDYTTTSYQLTGLTTDAVYEFYVRQDCGATDGESTWTGPYSFSVGYCSSVPTSNDNNGITNVSLGSASFPVTDVTYYNYTGSIIDIAAGTTVASSVTFETGYSYHTNIWIDLNDDGVFDSSSELVFQGESEQTGFTAGNPTTLDTSFFLDALANLGQHKMRIGTADSGQLTPNPCYSGSYGVTVDLMVNVTAPPSCIAPSGLSHTQLSTTSAELSWTSTGSLFDIEWGAQGFTQGSGTLVTDLTTTSYQLTGLTTDAVYEFYVLQDCGATDGESTWTGPYSFSVGYCSSVPTSNDNNGITNVSLGSASFPVTDVTYYNYTGSIIDIAAGTTVASSVTFETGWSYNTNIWIDLNDDGVFDSSSELVFQGESTNANPTTLDTSFFLDALANLGQHKMRIGTADSGQLTPDPCYSGSFGVTVDLMVNVTAPPSCVAPSGLSHAQLSMNSAELSWTSTGSLFDIEWGVQGFTQGSGTMVTDYTTTSYQLTGLTADVVYEFYVRQDCGATDGESTWAGPYSFSIGYCTPTHANGCGGGDNIDDFTLTGAGISHTGTGCSAGAYANYSNDLTLQGLVEQGAPYNFTATHGFGSQYVSIWIDFDDNGTFEASELLFVSTGGSAATSGTITIPADAPFGPHRMRVQTKWNSASTDVCNPGGYGETHDYTVTVVDPCAGVTAPMGDAAQTLDLGSTLADLDVTGTDLTWYSDADLTMEIADTTEVVDGTIYYVTQTVGDCTSDALAITVTVLSLPFPQPYCDVTFEYGVEPITLVQFGTINNATSNVINGTPALEDFTAISTDVQQSESYQITLKGNTGGSFTNMFRVFIDWNQDGDFDDAEESFDIGNINSSTGLDAISVSGSINVPLDAALGATRMRVIKKYNEFATACNTTGYGQAEDYTINVLAAPLCFSPTNLTALVSADNSDLSWNGTSGLYDIEWGTEGFTQGSGTTVNDLTTNSYSLIGLPIDTTYQFYVRQNCGTDGISNWAGPYSFFVGYCTVSTDWTSEYISGFSTSGAILNVNYTATSQPAGSYTNQTSQIIQQAPGLPIDFTSSYVGGNYAIKIWVDVNNDFAFDETTEMVSYQFGGSPQTGSVTVPDDLPLGDYRVRVRGQWGSTANPPNPPACGNVNYGSTIDFTLQVVSPPSCYPPTGMSHTQLSITSAELSWTSTGSLFDIEWGAQGFTQGSGTMVTDYTTTSYQLTGLTTDAVYEFYVRQDCGATDGESVWAGPYSFSVGYCTPTHANGCGGGDNIDDFTLTGAGISHTGTGCSAGAYANYSNDLTLQGLVEQGAPYNFTATHGFGGQYVSIWIDFDDNGTFEASELLFVSTGGSDATSGTITIPADAPFGPHRMRVQTKWNSASTDVCNPGGYGETHDYTVTVVDPCAGVTAPMGDAAQTLDLGSTLADLDVTGTDLTWYSDADLTMEIADTTEVVDGTIYYVTQTVGDCTSDALAITVTVVDPCAGVTVPTGDAAQTLDLGSTLADLDVTGTDLTWYSDADLTMEIADTTEVVDGTIYYVTQTVGDCTSDALAITVTVVDPCAGVTAPMGDAAQTLDLGSTLADLDVTGTDLTWYSDADLTMEIADTTEVVDGVTYYVTQTVGDCTSDALAITVTIVDPCAGITAPTADSPQMLTEGQTVADIVVTDVTGTLNWYSDEDLTVVVEETDILTEGVYTFWVTQTVGDCTSDAIEIMVEVSLSRNAFDEASFRAYPNPVTEFLNISYSKDITDVSVINMLGQVVISQTVSSTDTQVDMSALPTGSYLVKVTVDGAVKIIKVVKQ